MLEVIEDSQNNAIKPIVREVDEEAITSEYAGDKISKLRGGYCFTNSINFCHKLAASNVPWEIKDNTYIMLLFPKERSGLVPDPQYLNENEKNYMALRFLVSPREYGWAYHCVTVCGGRSIVDFSLAPEVRFTTIPSYTDSLFRNPENSRTIMIPLSEVDSLQGIWDEMLEKDLGPEYLETNAIPISKDSTNSLSAEWVQGVIKN